MAERKRTSEIEKGSILNVVLGIGVLVIFLPGWQRRQKIAPNLLTLIV